MAVGRVRPGKPQPRRLVSKGTTTLRLAGTDAPYLYRVAVSRCTLWRQVHLDTSTTQPLTPAPPHRMGRGRTAVAWGKKLQVPKSSKEVPNSKFQIPTSSGLLIARDRR